MSSTPAYSMDATGRSRGLPTLSATLELLKPITWFPPMWAFMCGAVSAGVALVDTWYLVLAGMVLAGPLVCATSQAINDWHDRHVDAINEPHRPIPSGRMPGRWGLYVAYFWALLSLAYSAILGVWIFVATLIGLFLAWAYSAPPLRLKQNGWLGNAACAICYEGLAWFTGAALLLGALPATPIILLAFLYSVGAHGIMALNDFKSVPGDTRMGVRTLPVQLGADRAARVASIVMAAPQVIVVALLLQWNLPYHAGVVALLLVAQIVLMMRFLLDRNRLLKEPRECAARYNATGTTLYVLGMLAAAMGVGQIAQVIS